MKFAASVRDEENPAELLIFRSFIVAEKRGTRPTLFAAPLLSFRQAGRFRRGA
jgi:hypothetical protein